MHPYSGVLEVNLTALRHNWRVLQRRFCGAECGAVVKANAYGLGVVPVVGALAAEGCQNFFVANYAEAIEIKPFVAVNANIYVLQGCPAGMELGFQDAGLIPVLISKTMVERWCQHARPGAARCALKVNTGMNRLGLSASELLQCVANRDLWCDAVPIALMSHLACAEEVGHSMNDVQLQRFDEALRGVRRYFPAITASLANTAALFLDRRWHFDLARPGIGLYGGQSAMPGVEALREVVTLRLPVIQVQTIGVGESIGYGGTFCAQREMRVAVVRGGYADGVMRSLSNKAYGWWRGAIPMVGRVSMDSCAFDITDVALSEQPEEGDMIEVLGPNCSLVAQSSRAGTISYEVLTRLGERLQKHYVE